MAENALTGSHIAAFKGIELHTYLSRITDSRGPRVVAHEYPYRDGALVETLGRQPHKTEWQLTFTGPKWLDDFLELARAIDDSPAGILVHPIYGQMQVVCEGFSRSVVDLADATDTISFPLNFVEAVLDESIPEATVSGLKQEVDNAADDYEEASAPYDATDTVAAVANVVSLATSFASSVLLVAQTLEADPSLAGQVLDIGEAVEAAATALQADPVAAESVAQVYDALAAGEVLFAKCIDLYEQLALETLSFTKHVVQGRSSIAVEAQRLFGAEAINYIDRLLSLNPQITDPTNIPAGTAMTVPLAGA